MDLTKSPSIPTLPILPDTIDTNKYDSGFIKHDLDFDSQNLLDQNRSQLINDHYDMSHLQQYIIQFKRTRNTNTTNHNIDDDSPKNDNNTDENNGKPLQFDCDFESGNIGEINHYRDNEYDLLIRGDTNNSRHSIWFYFRVKGGIAGNKLICHISNYSKGKSLYSEGFTPLVRSKTKPIWTRLPEYQVNWFKCNRHRKNCFTFSFIFDRTGDEYFFAYSFPYTYSYLQKFLSDIEKQSLPFVQRQLLARSVQQRRLDCLRIEQLDNDENSDTNSNSTTTQKDRPCIVFSSRVHPGETPSSYVMHGFIEFLLSDHESAVFLRKNVTMFVIPMLNPDGVFIGNYRCTSLGFDLNRHWQKPDFTQHPTICSLKYFLRQLDAANKLDFYMDLHAHTNATDGFMYCNQSQPSTQQMNIASVQVKTNGIADQQKENNNPTKDGKGSNNNNNSGKSSIDEPTTATLQLLHDQKIMERHYQRNNFTTIYPRLLDLHCNEYQFSKTKFCNNPKKAGSARRAMEAILSDIPVCYTFEVSFWKSKQKHSLLHDRSSREINLYTQETYRNLGRCMIQALCDMYKLPKEKRNDLREYNFKTKKFMKGDLRKRIQKNMQKTGIGNVEELKGVGSVRKVGGVVGKNLKEENKENKNDEDENKDNGSNKINVSIPSVPTI